ncbi:MAG: hypothetical protein CBB61_001500 [Gammaproteobacteria bacterium TMED1]|nr:MAG: hypothetical protein CBB61_001500 [Gammaproteobacteria bacterium TMED1]|tara:strand:+ start:991 stop:2127 length:1137 start_codon:yes stop_codon:yes gene_type:complete
MIEPDRVTSFPLGSVCEAESCWDLEGKLVLPAFADLHTHLDKTYSPIDNPEGGLEGAINAFRDYKAKRTPQELEKSASRALRKAVSQGVTRLRSHVTASAPEDVETIHVLNDVRNRFSGLIDLQLVAMGRFGQGYDRHIEACISAGADLVGGAPALQDEPDVAVARAVALAKDLNVALDLHIDEHLDPELCTLAMLCDEVERQGYYNPITAGHCASLVVLPEHRLGDIITKVKEIGINIVALPVCNMVLLGGSTLPYVRATAPVSRLLGDGVNVCLGSDNVRDPFNPFGGYSALRNLQISNILERTNSGEVIKDSLSLITDNAYITFDTELNHECDLVVVNSNDFLDALCEPPSCLATFKQGSLVFKSEVAESWFIEE